MALTKIFTGMELGPEAIDANFKALMAGAAIGVETFGREVYTLSNGASFPNDDNRLTAMELGNGYRIVQIEFLVRIANYQAAKNNTVVSIPLKYAPKIGWHPIQLGSGTNHVRWNVGTNGTIIMESVMNESGINADFWYPMDTIYITHD